jgi:hypothetical protein
MTGPRQSARRHPPKLYPSLPSGSATRPAALGTHLLHPQKILMLQDFLQKSRMVSRHRNAASKKNARCHRMQFFDTRSIARRLCWSRCWQRPARLPQRGAGLARNGTGPHPPAVAGRAQDGRTSLLRGGRSDLARPRPGSGRPKKCGVRRSPSLAPQAPHLEPSKVIGVSGLARNGQTELDHAL